MSGRWWRIGIVACVAWAGAGGCVSWKTYSAPVESLGARVTVRARLDDSRLQSEVSAGDFRVRSVALVTREGRRLEPTSTSREPDKVVGGANVGVGTGIGRGGVSVGVGTSRHVGGRVQPGRLRATWGGAPVDAQPWFIEAQLETDPPETIAVALGDIVSREDAPSPGDGPARQRQRWRLLDGSTQEFIVTPREGAIPAFHERSEPPG